MISHTGRNILRIMVLMLIAGLVPGASGPNKLSRRACSGPFLFASAASALSKPACTMSNAPSMTFWTAACIAASQETGSMKYPTAAA